MLNHCFTFLHSCNNLKFAEEAFINGMGKCFLSALFSDVVCSFLMDIRSEKTKVAWCATTLLLLCLLKKARKKDKELGKIKMNANNIWMKIVARKSLDREIVKTALFENFRRGLHLFSPGELDYVIALWGTP